MAKFKKGQSGNLGGRPKGIGNKSTEKVKKAFTALVEDNLDQLRDDINEMEPKDRAYFLKELAEYVLPKLARSENKNENTGEITVRVVDDAE